MTPKDLADKLKNIDINENVLFLNALLRKGIKIPNDRNGLVEYFIENPEKEGIIAHLLGLPTEAEKQTQAAVNAAEAAKKSARYAMWAAIIALLTVLVMLFGIFSQRAFPLTLP
jgi:uncharacterized membrane protein